MVRPPAHSVALLHHGLVLCLILITRFLKYILCYLFIHVARYESVPQSGMRCVQWHPLALFSRISPFRVPQYQKYWTAKRFPCMAGHYLYY